MNRFKLVILVAASCVFAWVLMYGEGARYQRKMEATGEFCTTVRPLVKADPRFAKVNVSFDTHPALTIDGKVADDKARAALAQLVYPPVNVDVDVIFNVQSDETDARYLYAAQHPRRTSASAEADLSPATR